MLNTRMDALEQLVLNISLPGSGQDDHDAGEDTNTNGSGNYLHGYDFSMLGQDMRTERSLTAVADQGHGLTLQSLLGEIGRTKYFICLVLVKYNKDLLSNHL